MTKVKFGAGKTIKLFQLKKINTKYCKNTMYLYTLYYHTMIGVSSYNIILCQIVRSSVHTVQNNVHIQVDNVYIYTTNEVKWIHSITEIEMIHEIWEMTWSVPESYE